MPAPLRLPPLKLLLETVTLPTVCGSPGAPTVEFVTTMPLTEVTPTGSAPVIVRWLLLTLLVR